GEILALCGGKENISAFTNCMTRLRLDLIDKTKADVAGIKKLDGILGVVDGRQMQIVVGPGHAQRLREAFEKVSGILGGAPVEEGEIKDVAADMKAKIKAQQKGAAQNLFRHVGNIFLPLIPGFIACGLVIAICNVLKMIDAGIVANPWFNLFAAIGSIMAGIMAVVIGFNSAREFGGSAILGAIAGALIYLPQLNGLDGQTLTIPLISITLKAGYGGVVGVLASAAAFAKIEGLVRKIVPAWLDLFLVPLITVIAGSIITFALIMPICAVLMDIITFILVDFALKTGGIVGGYILSATFLPLVMLGIHQGLVPIHAQLIAEHGYTVLLPVLACAGAGQVGMAIAVYVKTKDKKLRQIISSSLPIGFLGIGEPLIYGVSLPLFYPFITACLGAGFGGALIAFVTSRIGDVGATTFGLSGILMAAIIANKMWIWYLLGLVAAYIGGFVLTFLFGYKDEYLERLR
ncbi:MAG: PTS transporter subunit EIIC, partial [Elusimicrobiota bacterium]|nr:PTS transporter subunit EIIC [Elusimicrobiota bacterium]